jgi:hypothetical protein
MPEGSKGQKRPVDVIGATVMVMKIATGEITEETEPKRKSTAAALGRRGGHSNRNMR